MGGKHTEKHSVFKMAPLKFIVLVCALLAAQAQAYPQSSVEDISIIDIIKKLLGPAEKLVDEYFDKVDKIVVEISQDAGSLQAKSVDLVDKVLDRVWTGLEKKLDHVKEKGNDDTKKVVGCIEASGSDLKIIPRDIYDNSTKCLIPSIQEIAVLAADLHDDIQKIKTDAFDAANKLQDCEGDTLQETICALNVVKEWAAVFLNIPKPTLDKVGNIINKTKDVISKDVPPCVQPVIQRHVVRAYEVINNISTCIVH
ncbi:hypothetical protein JTB14_005198 [Gonioctena quinquepunctata]|nr:hypothetical protein JTB14_005198 [Gonioctena quinquepunctata]